jgi:hypothetical protein
MKKFVPAPFNNAKQMPKKIPFKKVFETLCGIKPDPQGVRFYAAIVIKLDSVIKSKF